MSLSHLSGPAEPPAAGVLVLACVRDAALRLPDFLTHHRRLGAAHFLIVDNASTDGTADLLQAQADVSLYHTAQSYAESRCGVDWMNALLDAHGCGRWCLILDDDEHFVFPGWEGAPLAALTAWLERTGAEAMVAPMLDMYPAGPLAALDYRPGQPLAAACPWFDAEGYDRDANGHLHRGGARHRLFWAGRERPFPSPVLRKTPLVRWREGLALTASTHLLPGARVSQATGLLLHFKFLQDFAASAAEEARRGEHFAGARQYVAYADVMGADPGFTAWYPGSVRLENSAQLVRLGLMQVPDGYPSDLSQEVAPWADTGPTT